MPPENNLTTSGEKIVNRYTMGKFARFRVR